MSGTIKALACPVCGAFRLTVPEMDAHVSAEHPADAMRAWTEAPMPDPLSVLRRVFQATPSSIDSPDHHPEGLWACLGYDVEANQWDNSDCDMERLRAPVEALLRDVNRVLGCALPLPPYVECDDVDEDEPCDRCKEAS